MFCANPSFRPCLICDRSSTPIVNSLSDAYGLIRFLQLRPWNDWHQFNQLIGRIEKRRPKLATDRLQTIFKTTLLRRNKDTVLDGKKLITLPPKTVELVKLEFCPEEREIYQVVSTASQRFPSQNQPDLQVETKSQQIFNRFLRAGTVLKNYHYSGSCAGAFVDPPPDTVYTVLVLLLRLRQICNHPALISEREGGPEAVGRTRAEAEVARAVRSFGEDFVSKVRAKIRDLETERMEVELTVRGLDPSPSVGDLTKVQ